MNIINRLFLSLLAYFILSGTILASESSQSQLWVADTKTLTNINPIDGSQNTSLSDIGYISALAINNAENTLWAYSDDGLVAYTLNGQEKFINYLSQTNSINNSISWMDEDINQGALAKGFASKAYLQVNTKNNTIWLAVGDTLSHFDKNQLLNQFNTSDTIQSIAFDSQNIWLWVATKKSLIAYDEDFSIMQEISLGRWDRVQEISYDSRSEI